MYMHTVIGFRRRRIRRSRWRKIERSRRHLILKMMPWRFVAVAIELAQLESQLQVEEEMIKIRSRSSSDHF